MENLGEKASLHRSDVIRCNATLDFLSRSAYTSPAMSEATNFKSFEAELNRLVETFGRNLSAYKSSAYDEASFRQEFLNPFFRALGWDIENRAGLIPQHREVETESRTQIGGRQKRADYLFRTHPIGRFDVVLADPQFNVPTVNQRNYNLRSPKCETRPVRHSKFVIHHCPRFWIQRFFLRPKQAPRATRSPSEPLGPAGSASTQNRHAKR